MVSNGSCSLTALFAMSCRDHVEKFAHTLQNKLRSLGSSSSDADESIDETSWLKAQSGPVESTAETTRAHTEENGHEFDRPGSPPERATETEHEELTVNENDDLPSLDAGEKFHFDSGFGVASPAMPEPASDADANEMFYEPELQECELFKAANCKVNRCSSLESNNSFESAYSFDLNDSDNILSLNDLKIDNAETKKENSNGLESYLHDINMELKNLKEKNNANNTIKSMLSFNDTDDLPIRNGFKTIQVCSMEIVSTKPTLFESSSSDEANASLAESEPGCPTNDSSPDKKERSATECEREENASASQSSPNESKERIYDKSPRVRRCSSLKVGKTPPGTPGKIVRFADALGLDLADVRTYLDEVPKVPNSAYSDLDCGEMSPGCSEMSMPMPVASSSGQNRAANKLVIPLFQQPGGQPDFLDRVRNRQCCLENVVVDEMSISGTVRVRNLDFHKSVYVRYTLDNWEHFSDLQATYVLNSCDGFSDTFKFLLYTHTLGIGQRLEFAVKFQCKGSQYWDNNGGTNYCFQCLPGGSGGTSYLPITSPEEHWSCGAFY